MCKGIQYTDGECPDGKVPTLSRDNYEIWGLFQLMLPGLMRMEGYDYNAITVVTDTLERETGKQLSMEMLTKIIKLIDIISAERRIRADKK